MDADKAGLYAGRGVKGIRMSDDRFALLVIIIGYLVMIGILAWVAQS